MGDAVDRMPILEQRRIEAGVIKPIYEEMVRELGEAVAKRILGNAIRRAAIEAGRSYAASEGKPTDLESFAALLPQWTANGALEIEVVARDAARFDYNVTRCRYAEMYRAMGLGEVGHLLSCNRDGSFCTGYDPRIRMERRHTIMQGASHCDFRYRLVEGAEAPATAER